MSKDLDGIITSWNRAAERLFGFAEAEVIGRSITIIIPPDRLEEEARVLGPDPGGEPVEMETIRQCKDGTLHPDLVDGLAGQGRRSGGSSAPRRSRATSERPQARRARSAPSCTGG